MKYQFKLPLIVSIFTIFFYAVADIILLTFFPFSQAVLVLTKVTFPVSKMIYDNINIQPHYLIVIFSIVITEILYILLFTIISFFIGRKIDTKKQ